MKRPAASVLLLAGGIVILLGLPLQWSTAMVGDLTLASRRGLDYAGYDVATTVALGALLVVAAFAGAGGQRWGHRLAVAVAVMAALWAALVFFAAANPIDGSSPGVTVSVGAGVYVTVAGALLGLIGAVLGLRGRSVAVVTSGEPSSV